jgi:hypothetical protein
LNRNPNKRMKNLVLVIVADQQHKNAHHLTASGGTRMNLDELEVRLSGQCRNTVQYLTELHGDPEQWQYGLQEMGA